MEKNNSPYSLLFVHVFVNVLNIFLSLGKTNFLILLYCCSLKLRFFEHSWIAVRHLSPRDQLIVVKDHEEWPIKTVSI